MSVPVPCSSRRLQFDHNWWCGVGIIITDLPASTFPAWILPVLHALMSPIAISEEDSGIAHLEVITSDNVARRSVSYFNFLREGRETVKVAYDKALGQWVWETLEMYRQGQI